jgi:hypothetical protein
MSKVSSSKRNWTTALKRSVAGARAAEPMRFAQCRIAKEVPGDPSDRGRISRGDAEPPEIVPYRFGNPGDIRAHDRHSTRPRAG